MDSKCAYCGKREGTTDDHIPPRSIYHVPAPPSRPHVRACEQCHAATSDDDEYFRDTIVKHHLVGDKPSAQTAVEKMLRAVGMPKKASYARAMLRSMCELEIRTPAGLFLGRQVAFNVDWVRIERACDRYVRGLHYYTLGERVPDAARVHVQYNPDNNLKFIDQIMSVFSPGIERQVQSKVFWYAWVQPKDTPGVSGWLLMFYSALPILGFVYPPDSAPALARVCP